MDRLTELSEKYEKDPKSLTREELLELINLVLKQL